MKEERKLLIQTQLGLSVGCLYATASSALLRMLNCSILVDGLAHTAAPANKSKIPFSANKIRKRSFFLYQDQKEIFFPVSQLGSLLDTYSSTLSKGKEGLIQLCRSCLHSGAAAGPMALATTSILATTA